MAQRKVELAVGAFVLAGILCLAYLSVSLGSLTLFETGVYEVSAKFSSVSGLRVGTSVEMAGVQVGRVKSIALDEDEAVVVLLLDASLKISSDTIASVRTKGILGDSFVNLSPGGSEKIISAGGRIRETEPPLDIQKIIGDFIYGAVK